MWVHIDSRHNNKMISTHCGSTQRVFMCTELNAHLLRTHDVCALNNNVLYYYYSE